MKARSRKRIPIKRARFTPRPAAARSIQLRLPITPAHVYPIDIDTRGCLQSRDFLQAFCIEYRRLRATYPHYVLVSRKSLVNVRHSDVLYTPQTLAQALIGLDRMPRLVEHSVTERWVSLTFSTKINTDWIQCLIVQICRSLGKPPALEFFSTLSSNRPYSAIICQISGC